MGLARAVLVTVLTGLVVAGCAGQEVSPSQPTPTAVGAPISKATWTDGVWPFTVPDGVLKCYAEDGMVTFTAGGTEYGLIETARRFGHFPDIDAIVPDGPDGYVEVDGTRQPVRTNAVSLDGIYALVRDLCD
ncbi:hypothetical protein ABQF34_21655 [Mycolicibacterium boenickei]